jgi:serine/threonine protein kinase/tetratricopeptide (TPR) repeat protein
LLNAGDKIQHYELVRLLGKGGMGEVYLARDSFLDRNVALKFLPDELENDPRMRERFLREAKSAAALDHPFICKIYETGSHQGKGYIAMEYVEGKTLKDRMEEGPVPLRDAVRFSVEIGEALENAHKAGIVHRDLKPANIMISPQGHTKVMDFGLAKHILPQGDLGGMTKTLTQQSITEHGAIAGTIAYMSPEQAKGGTIDGRSDIFSLGIILYEMITGKNPFSKPSPIETLTSILRDAAPATHVTPKSVNPVLNPIVRKALAKNPEERYLKISDLVADLKDAQHEITGGGRLFARLVPIIGAAVLVVILAVFAINRFVLHRPAPPAKAEPKSVSVLIADATNTTGEALFEGVLEKILSVSLGSTSYITVIDTKAARQQAVELNPASEGRLNLETAQLIGRRLGINAVVIATIEPNNSGYRIKASAWDPTKSEKIAEAEQSIKAKADVLKIADILSAKLRSGLGVIPADSTEALIKETFTTNSLEAMNAYAKGQELDDLGRPDEAIAWLRKALDYDPNFGRAYTTLGVIFYNRGQYEDAKRYFQEGIKRIDQMTDREKYRARGPYYLMVRNFKKAIEEYSALLKQFPGDYSAHANLALAYFFARDMPKAVDEGLLDIGANPQSINGRYNLSWYALGAGDFAMAEEETRKVLAARPEFAEAYVSLALSQLAQDKAVQAAETYGKVAAVDTFGASIAATGLADIAVYEGRLADAASILRNGISFDQENKWTYNAADKSIMLADILFLQGKRAEALAAVDRALGIDKNDTALFSAARICIKAGQLDRARDFAAALSKKLEPEPLAYAKMIGGEMSLARGDARNAIGLFQEAEQILDTWLGRLLLGRAYLEAGAFTEAYSEFELCLKRKGESASVFLNDLPSFRFFPPVYYYLGRAQEGLGSDAAPGSFREFLRIKEKADSSDPLVGDARSRTKFK